MGTSHMVGSVLIFSLPQKVVNITLYKSLGHFAVSGEEYNDVPSFPHTEKTKYATYPYFSLHKTHLSIRRTNFLRRRKQENIICFLRSIRRTDFPPPLFCGGKVRLMVQKIQYIGVEKNML